MSRILVTGSRGLLGSACKRLFSKTDEVLETGKADLRNRGDVYWLFNHLRPDYVIHCAAKVGGVKANRDNPVEFIEDNVSINSNVIAACYLFGVKKLVNIGTSCMFPENAPVPVKESSFMTGPLNPDVEAYAQAKILAYSLCNAYRRQHNCNFVTVAPCNLYGPNDNYSETAHVIPGLVKKAVKAKETASALKVWGNGSSIREFLHSDDAASAIKVVLEKYDSPELISIGSGESTTIRYLANLIGHHTGIDLIEWLPGEPTGIQEKTFDTTKILGLGWQTSISLFDGIGQVCLDYKNNINIRDK